MGAPAKDGRNICEPDYGDLVHFPPAPCQDAVTFCNKTDWIGETPGYETNKRVTCLQCRRMVRWARLGR